MIPGALAVGVAEVTDPRPSCPVNGDSATTVRQYLYFCTSTASKLSSKTFRAGRRFAVGEAIGFVQADWRSPGNADVC